jgi:hypothetical protein
MHATTHNYLRIRAAAALVVIGLLAAAAAGLATAGSSSAYWVCSPTSAVTRGPDFRCKGDSYNGALSYIQKDSSPRAYGVYRSSVYGGGSISGTEFFSPDTNKFSQDFGCNPGYPNAHNRNSVDNRVEYTLAGSC